MPNKFYYTYMIYCNEPSSSMYGCIYYGQHRTNNLLDGYIASGRKISNYIKKYPNGYYRKILNIYSSLKGCNQAEYNLIHQHLNKPYCLNLREGGNGKGDSEETRKLKSESHMGEKNVMYGHSVTDFMTENEIKAWRQAISDGTKGENNPMYGKNFKNYMTEEAYNKWYQTRLGKNNPMYDKHYIGITNGMTNKFIDPSEFDKYEKQGYWKGHIRKNKNKNINTKPDEASKNN